MNTPPFLLLAALLFWGWQSQMLIAGAIAGVLLEGSRLLKWRWDFEDTDFNRIWSLCVLVVMVLFGYIFTTNGEGGGWSGIVHGGPAAAHNATVSSTMATTTVLRWFPLIFFPFIGAQVYNLRPTVPLTSVSLVLRWRRRRAGSVIANRYVDAAYPYFILCIFSAGIHPNTATYTYFWGQAVLILWALWALRRRRFTPWQWAAAIAAVIAIGFLGQMGIREATRMAQNFEARLLARWMRGRTDAAQSITSIGHIGELMLSPRIVIRLQPEQPGQAPSYLREASYRTYSAQNLTWYAGGSVNNFIQVQPLTDNSTWPLLANKTNTATVNIACYLNGRSTTEDHEPQGLLPLPSGTWRLSNLPLNTSVAAVETNQTGAVLVTGNGLQIFDASYGPGATFDSPPDPSTNALDLLVPTNEIPALDHIIAEAGLTNATSDEALRQQIESFFLTKFTYSTWQGREKRGDATNTPVTKFLLHSRSGHCEYFATATVLLLRHLHVPARYAVGYYVHETAGTGYVVRERDAHAWVLAWDESKKLWVDFDTTPGSWVSIEGRHGALTEWFSDLRSWLMFQFEKLRWHQTNLRQYILWTLVPVIVVLIYYIIFQRRTKRRIALPSDTDVPIVWPGHDSAFYRLEKVLATRGLPRASGETLADWLDRTLADPALVALREPLRELVKLHYRYRFDPRGLSDAEKTALIENVEAVLRTFAK